MVKPYEIESLIRLSSEVYVTRIRRYGIVSPLELYHGYLPHYDEIYSRLTLDIYYVV